MIQVTSQRVIEVIRDEICNSDLNSLFIGYSLNCGQTSLWKCVKEDFNITPYKLIQNVRCHKIFKYTYDHKESIYLSASYYGISKPDTFYKLIKNKFNKTPCEIEYELAIAEDRKRNHYRYQRMLMVHGLIL